MPLSAAQTNEMATAISESESMQGIDFQKILDFIKQLMPTVMALPCLAAAKKDPAKLQARLEDNYRDVRKDKQDRIPKKVRKLMEQNDFTDDNQQHEIWDVASEQAFLNAKAYAKAAAK